MKTNELRKDDRVLVTDGLWNGFVGVVEDVHEEASVVRLRSDGGEAAYALKEHVKVIHAAQTT